MIVAGLAALTVLAYLPSLRGGFLFDDHSFVLRNLHVLDGDLAAIVSHSPTAGAGVESNFFRPQQQGLFALLANTFGTSSSLPFHALSLSMHLTGGLLCFLWLRRMQFAAPLALIALGLFWLHPVQTEAVSYISGLGDPLAHAWMWAGMLAFERMSRPGSPPVHGRAAYAALCLVCMLLALTAKESAVVLAPWLLAALLYRAWRDGPPPRAAITTVAAAILLAGAWSALKLSVWNFTGRSGLTPEHSVYAQDLTLRLTTFVSVLADYARLIVMPWPLYYEKAAQHYPDLLTARGIFGLGVLAMVAIVLLGWRRWPRLALACALGCSAMLPYTGLIALNATLLEHWLYMAMPGLGLGFACLMAAALQPWKEPEALPIRAAQAVCVVFALAGAGVTAWRAAQWADPVTFYRHELEHGPANHRVLTNLGMALAETQQWSEAERYLREAIAAAPSGRFADGHYNLAVLLLRTQRISEARLELQRALRTDPLHRGAAALTQRIDAAPRGD